jgi:regulatory protein
LAAAYAAAVALLSRRDFASTELRARLEQRGFEAAVVTAALAQLVEEHVLDDARFARHSVASHAERGRGPLRIAADLKGRGLGAELIDSALDSGPDWYALASEVRARKFGPEIPTAWAEKGRQSRFLQYRGFSSDHIRGALGPSFDPDD